MKVLKDPTLKTCFFSTVLIGGLCLLYIALDGVQSISHEAEQIGYMTEKMTSQSFYLGGVLAAGMYLSVVSLTCVIRTLWKSYRTSPKVHQEIKP